MKILDRYIARQYATNIVSLYVILFAFVVTIDVAMNLDSFWRVAGGKASPEVRVAWPRDEVLALLSSVYDPPEPDPLWP